MRNTIKKLFILSSIFFSQHSFAMFDRSDMNCTQYKPSIGGRFKDFGWASVRAITDGEYGSKIDKELDKISRENYKLFEVTSDQDREQYASFWSQDNREGDPSLSLADVDLDFHLSSIKGNSDRMEKLEKLKNKHQNMGFFQKRRFDSMFKEFYKNHEYNVNRSIDLFNRIKEGTAGVSETYRKNKEVQRKLDNHYNSIIQKAQDQLKPI